jgi:hypothetical protein
LASCQRRGVDTGLLTNKANARLPREKYRRDLP